MVPNSEIKCLFMTNSFLIKFLSEETYLLLETFFVFHDFNFAIRTTLLERYFLCKVWRFRIILTKIKDSVYLKETSRFCVKVRIHRYTKFTPYTQNGSKLVNVKFNFPEDIDGSRFTSIPLMIPLKCMKIMILGDRSSRSC